MRPSSGKGLREEKIELAIHTGEGSGELGPRAGDAIRKKGTMGGAEHPGSSGFLQERNPLSRGLEGQPSLFQPRPRTTGDGIGFPRCWRMRVTSPRAWPATERTR